MDTTDISVLGFGSKKTKVDKSKNSFKASKDVFTKSDGEFKKPIISRPTDKNEYNTHNPNVGIALIFNHKEIRGQDPRLGTEKDRDRMWRSLSLFGFDVRTFDDLTFDKLSEQLKSVAKEDHSKNDCLVVVVMSHGLEGKICAKDMSYPVERLWNPFLGENSKTLINKPKLFFIQACRGQNLEKPVVYNEFAAMSRSFKVANFMEANEPAIPITYAIPNRADLLVMYSTFDKFFSFRNVGKGSWFIQSLCSVLEEAASNAALSDSGSEIYQLLTAVNRKVAYEYQSDSDNVALNDMKEMPNFLSTLTKMFYLKVKTKK